MRYYLHYGHSLVPKNKLDKAIQDYFKSIDGVLIGEGKLNGFKAHLSLKISQLNGEHSRCTPIKIDFWSPDGNKTIKVGGIFCVDIWLYSVNSDFNY